MMTFVKLLRNPGPPRTNSLRTSLSTSPVLLHNFTHVFAALFGFRSGFRPCSGPGLAGVRASKRCRCSCVSSFSCHGLQGAIGLVVPLFTEIGLRGLVRGLLGPGI